MAHWRGALLNRDPDTTLIRHVYDLHLMRGHLDPMAVAALACDIARADAGEFRNQYPPMPPTSPTVA